MKAMKILIALLMLCCCTIAGAQEVIGDTDQMLTSPDGAYQFHFYQKQLAPDSRQMYYTVSFKGKTVIEESELGVLIENELFESALGIANNPIEQWCQDLRLTDVQCHSTDETWKPVYGERSTIRNNYNELILKFRKGSGKENIDNGYDKTLYYYMDVVIRAYNEGVAFRYHFPEATNGLFLHITGEQTQFTLPSQTMAWYERWAQGPYSLQPLTNWGDECERPLTMKLANGLTVALTEAEMTDYARMKFRLAANRPNTLQASLYSSVDVITPYNTPWRVIMAAEKPYELINNNDIILNLNPGNQIKNTGWIKPGKVIRSGLSQSEAIECIDFAARRGLQYVHLDAGWYGPEMQVGSNATAVRKDKDIDLPALTRYAATKGIGIFVYVNQRALYRQLDEILPLYKQWGIKGIKFGFVQIGNQKWTTWLHDAVRKCAEHEILVDIHDEYRPTGFSRTFPNLLTQEGIRGNEEMPDATHNTILPFTRFLAGAADYTICYYSPRIKTTHAHQLALAAVYYSPLQYMYWYDNPAAYQGEPEIEFFDKVKSVWDNTRAIAGEPGEYVTIARQSGEQWFLGSIGNNESRTISTPLNFLPEGQKFEATIYTDDNTVATKTRVRVKKQTVDSKTVMKFNLEPSGGVAMHLEPKKK